MTTVGSRKIAVVPLSSGAAFVLQFHGRGIRTESKAMGTVIHYGEAVIRQKNEISAVVILEGGREMKSCLLCIAHEHGPFP